MLFKMGPMLLKFESDKPAACATASDDTQTLLLTLMHPDHEGTRRFKSQTVVSLRPHCDFHQKIVHGLGTVTLERATGETSETSIVLESNGHS